MKTMNKRLVAFGALLAVSLICGTNPAAAQSPKELRDRLMERAKNRLPGGGATAEVFTSSALSSRIVSLAASMDGKYVGGGECTHFVERVLQRAGAKPGENYVWGQRRIKSLGKAGAGRPKRNVADPGNIIQFWDCRFEDPKGNWWEYGAPGHTAIVKSVRGSEVTLLHQNAPRGSKVHQDIIDLGWLKRGSYKIYVAQPK